MSGLRVGPVDEAISVFDFLSVAELADVRSGAGAVTVDSLVNTAVARAAAISVRVVGLPAGTFTLAAPIYGKSNVTLRGAGKGKTVIKRTVGGSFAGLGLVDLPNEAVTGFGIESLTLDGNKANNPGTSSHCFRAFLNTDYSNIAFRNVAFINASNGGVYLEEGTGYRFDRCDFDDNGLAVNPTSPGIFAEINVTDLKFVDCRFRRNYEHGAYTVVNGFLYENCLFEANGSNGLSLRGGYGSVVRNRCTSNGRQGITVNTQYQRVKNVLIKGNIIDGTGNAFGGINVDDDSENIEVVDNIITPDAFSSGRGILLAGANNGNTAKNIKISRNIIENYAEGVRLSPDALANVSVDDNVMSGDGTNAYIPVVVLKNTAAASLTGDNLSIRGNSAKLANNAISIQSTCDVDNVRISDNHVTDLSGVRLTDSVSNLGIGSPSYAEKWNARTVISLNFGTVTAHTSKDANAALTGAGLGAYASVTPLATAATLPAGLVWCLMSDSGNSGRLIVRMANVTAADITVGAVDFYVEARK